MGKSEALAKAEEKGINAERAEVIFGKIEGIRDYIKMIEDVFTFVVGKASPGIGGRCRIKKKNSLINMPDHAYTPKSALAILPIFRSQFSNRPGKSLSRSSIIFLCCLSGRL